MQQSTADSLSFESLFETYPSPLGAQQYMLTKP